MRKRRIFLGLLLVIALMAFAGCSTKDDGANTVPNTPSNVTDSNGDGMYDDGVKDNTVNEFGSDVNRAVDDAGRAVEHLVTDGAVKDNNKNL